MPPIVNQTMKTASARATPASSSIHSIALGLRFLGLVAAAILIGACVSQTRAPSQLPSVQWRAVAFSDVPGWTEDRLDDAWRPFVSGCTVLLERLATKPDWRDICIAARASEPRDAPAARSFFEQHFTAYELRTTAGGATALVTGYYEPLLHGSRERDDRYRYPLYGPPDDLLIVDLAQAYPELADKRLRGRLEGKRVLPYWARADIEAGRTMLAGKELFYVDDSLAAFFLQIQGSGRVELPDGSVVRVGYADQNGWPYRAIGKLLVEHGELSLEQVSMQSIRQWAKEHPQRLPSLLAENPSYVFFREVTPDSRSLIDGPSGTLGVPLNAGRAIAVDAGFIPLGSPVFLSTTRPSSGAPLNRLTMAHDTGGAIRGPLRADFFWGFGDEAEREAGLMKQDGRMWLLWPKDLAPPG